MDEIEQVIEVGGNKIRQKFCTKSEVRNYTISMYYFKNNLSNTIVIWFKRLGVCLSNFIKQKACKFLQGFYRHGFHS